MAWWERMPRSIQMWITIILSLSTFGSIVYAKGAKAVAGNMEDIPDRVQTVERRVGVMEADMAETRCYVKAFALKRDPLSDCAPMLNERRP